MLHPKCIYQKSIFAKCTQLACLLSFASIFFYKYIWIFFRIIFWYKCIQIFICIIFVYKYIWIFIRIILLIGIYSDIRSYHFLDKNIFKYSFVSKIYIRHPGTCHIFLKIFNQINRLKYAFPPPPSKNPDGIISGTSEICWCRNNRNCLKNLFDKC